MRIIFLIAQDSVRALLQQRLFLGLGMVSLGLILFFSLVSRHASWSITTETHLTPGSPGLSNSAADSAAFSRGLKNNVLQLSFYWISSIGGGLMTVFFFSTIIPREIRSGTVRMTLSKPVARWQYLLGRYLGGVVVMAGYNLLMGGTLAVLAVSHALILHPMTAAALWLMFCFQLMLGALTVLFSLLMPSFIAAIMAFCAGNGFYSSPNPLYFILPSYGDFNALRWIISGRTISGHEIVLLTIYAIDFVAICLLMAVWRFRQKELI